MDTPTTSSCQRLMHCAGRHRRVKRHLVVVGSEGGTNCIACHLFNEREAATMQMADLTEITSRVQKDWFQRHLVNPAGFNPGTRMPGFGVLAGELDDDDLEA